MEPSTVARRELPQRTTCQMSTRATLRPGDGATLHSLTQTDRRAVSLAMHPIPPNTTTILKLALSDREYSLIGTTHTPLIKSFSSASPRAELWKIRMEAA